MSGDADLKQFRRLPLPLRIAYGRPRTFIALAFGVAAFFLLPSDWRLTTRLVTGWDVFLGLYIATVFTTTLHSGVDHIRRNAARQDDGRFLILLLTALGAFASLAAIVVELGVKGRGAWEVTLALSTLVLSWVAVHIAFALHYAHEFYHEDDTPGGLAFPARDSDNPEDPDYWDFVYFSFVIGMTFQVSDVGITDRTIRRTVTAHGVISFVYNTALIALMVNIAASAI